jgi:hypothetical protein
LTGYPSRKILADCTRIVENLNRSQISTALIVKYSPG